MKLKEDIISQLEDLIKEEIAEELFVKADEVKNEYLIVSDQMNHNLLDKFVEEGGNAADFTPPKDPHDGRFNELIHILSDRENKFKKLQKEEISTKLSLKQEILSELEKLVTGENKHRQGFSETKRTSEPMD